MLIKEYETKGGITKLHIDFAQVLKNGYSLYKTDLKNV